MMRNVTIMIENGLLLERAVEVHDDEETATWRTAKSTITLRKMGYYGSMDTYEFWDVVTIEMLPLVA